MKKPNFFIIGAPRCGTTFLYSCLRQHPEIYMPHEKEPHFFGSDLRKNRDRCIIDETEYLALFKGAGQKKILGEASVFYLYSKKAPYEIYNFDKNSKIIVMLRHPVDLIYSLHSKTYLTGDEDQKDFKDALALEDSRKRGQNQSKNLRLKEDVLYRTYIKRIPDQLKTYIELFGHQNVLIILLNELHSDPGKQYKKVLYFLGADENFQPEFAIKNQNRIYRSKVYHEFFVHHSLF